jgi:DNA N-6-adenine-methyltransferase (Dam)
MSTNEWYTPSRYVEASRQVMGGIELDPASCTFANEIVKAERIYTKAENGLMFPWVAQSVFLNPPYGKTAQGAGSNLEQFTRHVVEQYQCGNTKQAILLIPVNTATRWFTPLWVYPICFPSHRIRFYSEKGPSTGISFGTCFVYFGPHTQHFIEVFSKFGTIVGRLTPAQEHYPKSLWTEVSA